MTILFLTLSKSFLNPDFVSQRGIYTDLLREFEKNGHRVYVVAPAERRNMQVLPVTKNTVKMGTAIQ